MRFTPLTPRRLVIDLADWIVDLPHDHPRVGFDGPDQVGAGALADAVAERLGELGRAALRASTDWWWRPASLRLELGRTDIDMLLRGWVDSAALRRELLDPLGPDGSGSYLLRLRDPLTDRSVRDERMVASGRAVLLLDGPFLLVDELPLDAVVYLQTSRPTLVRALPADRQWWLAAFDRYGVEERPADNAAAVIAYDHPNAPALAWPVER
ncbi:MAG: uridine kinase [Nakamurella sp.]